MIDPLIDPESRAEALRALFGRLRFGQNAAIVGLNDVGKTTLFGLAHARPIDLDADPADRGPLTVVVDCNHLARASEPELYAVMARGLAEAAARRGETTAGRLAEAYLQRGATGHPPAAVPAALELEAVLVRVAEQTRLTLAFLFDEFDGMYRQMAARTALALRAFHNRLGPALAYVVAVDQPLERIRPGVDDDDDHAGETAEFEELFVGGTHLLRPLEGPAAESFVARYFRSRSVAAPDWVAPLLAELSGGHPGLLWAACAAAQGRRFASRAKLEQDLLDSPEVRAECENVWKRLPAAERQAVAGQGRSAPALTIGTQALLEGLRDRGLLRAGPAGPAAPLAIPFLAHYVAHTAHAAPVGLSVDAQTGEVSINGRPPPAPLGPTEFRLLLALYDKAGALVTKDEIARAVWPREERLEGVDDARIDKLVDRVRAKIEPNPRAPRHLVTVRGLGYRLMARQS